MLQKAYYGLGSNERCIHLSLFVVSFILSFAGHVGLDYRKDGAF